MSEFKPNESQKNFLEAKGSNVLVSASAGSGKTSTMIKKILGILDSERIDISSIVVVTYTNASGSELKQKIYNAISEIIVNTDKEEDREYYKKQLDNLSNAEIGTLHSICKKLIVKYFYVIDQSPDFNLLSEKDADYILDIAIEDVLKSHIVNNDEEYFTLYNSYNFDRSDRNVRSLIKELYHFSLSKPNYKEWRENTTKSSYNLDLENNPACNYIIFRGKQSLKGYTNGLEKLLLEAKTFGYEKYLDYIGSWIQFLHAFLETDGFVKSFKVLNNFETVSKPRKNKNMDEDTLDFDERTSAYVSNVSASIETIKKNLGYDNLEDIANSLLLIGGNLNKLFELTDEVCVCYANYKKSRNVLDFSDLENKMLEILDNDIVRNELKEHYKYVFADEYQDINALQELILSKLTSNDNYYMIGDVKQSIYAFRQASPKIFIDKYNDYRQEGSISRVINFNENYRSEKNILGACNKIFDTLITEDTIGIDYRNSARFKSQKELSTGRVHLNIIDIEDRTEENAVSAESLLIANEILKIMNMHKADGTRFDYKDIAIIVRSRGELVKAICKTLTAMHIPVTAQVPNDMFDSYEISVLLSILKVIAREDDDLAIAVVLKNLFGLDEDELLAVKEFSPDSKTYFEAYRNYTNKDIIGEKLNKFSRFIEDSRVLFATETIKAALSKIIDIYGLDLYFKSLDDGLSRSQNVTQFLDLLSSENYEYDLDKLLNYVEMSQDLSSKQYIGTSNNAVQICTIHHSKGLEYPAVIFAGMGKKITTNKDSGNIVISQEFGIGLKNIDIDGRDAKETVVRMACKMANAKSEFDEEIRLMYVAMTRPREYLSMVGIYDTSKLMSLGDKSIYLVGSEIELLMKAFSNDDIKNIAKKEDVVIDENLDSQINVHILPIGQIDVKEDTATTPIVFGSVSDELLTALNSNKIDKPKTPFAVKNTVTNILREEVDYENLLSKPRTFSLKDGLENVDYLKLGTAYHTIMQRLNFNETKEEIEILRESLIASGYVEKSVADSIDISQIYDAICNLQDMIKTADVVYREKQFLMQENYNKLVKNSDNNTKVIVQGVIDLVVVKDGSAIVIDYKTNKVRREDFYKAEYGLQLDIYKKAFELATNIQVTAKYIYSFELGKLIYMD